MKKAVENNITGKDKIITEVMFNNFLEELSLELTKFICRISSTEVIDLGE